MRVELDMTVGDLIAAVGKALRTDESGVTEPTISSQLTNIDQELSSLNQNLVALANSTDGTDLRGGMDNLAMTFRELAQHFDDGFAKMLKGEVVDTLRERNDKLQLEVIELRKKLEAKEEADAPGEGRPDGSGTGQGIGSGTAEGLHASAGGDESGLEEGVGDPSEDGEELRGVGGEAPS